MAQKTVQNYLDEFKSQWITDLTRLKTWYDKWMSTLTWENQIAFKNAYNQYTSSLPSTTNENKTTAQDVVNKITPSNAQNTLNTAQQAYNSWQLSNADYLTIKNNAQNVKYNELNPNPLTSPVTSSPWTNNQNTDTNTNTPVNITNTADAWASAVDLQNQNIQQAQTQQWEYKNLMEWYIQEDKNTADLKIQQAEASAKREEELIKDYDNKVAQLEKEMQARYDERLNRDVEAMKQLKEVEVNKMDNEMELAKWKDEQAIKKMERDVEVQSLQANWAFNKMGAWFSAAAISTTSRIATEWANAIAWLKIQSNYNQADLQNKISKIEFDYSTEINATIDKYTDLWIKLKEQSITRIYNTQNALNKTQKEKDDAINKIRDDFRAESRKYELSIYQEMERLRDKQLDLTKQLEADLIARENREKEKVNWFMATWTWSNMSAIEKKNYADKTWMTVDELEKTHRNAIYASSVKHMQSILWADFLPSVAETDEIQSEVNRLMLTWRTMDEAITIATNRIIKRSPVYAKIQESKLAKWKATWTKIKTSDMKQMADGNWYAWTGAEWVNTWAKWSTSPSNIYLDVDDKWNRIIIDKITWEASNVRILTENERNIYWPNSQQSALPTYSYENVKAWKVQSNNTSNLSNDAFMNELNSQLGLW